MLHLTDTIREAVNDGKQSVLVGLDLSKAFDRVDHIKLISKLRNYFRFSTTACNIISSYLSGRSQFVFLNGAESNLLPVECGVPQGSVLGPLLFVLYVNDIGSANRLRNCVPFLYADDIHLLFRGNSLNTLEENINSTLEEISVWLENNNFSVNVSKTKALFFGSLQNDSNAILISINGIAIDFVHQMKCLGVILDDELDFGSHINSLYSKVFFILRRLYCTNIYLPRYIKRIVAKAVLLSHINYCIEVISGTSVRNLHRIEKLLKVIVRYVFGLRRYEHVSSYVVQFLGYPFRTFVELRTITFFYKLILCNAPTLLRNRFIFCRSTRNPQISPNLITTSIYERSYFVRVYRIWNNLPLNLRAFTYSNYVFRQKYLEHALNSTTV